MDRLRRKEQAAARGVCGAGLPQPHRCDHADDQDNIIAPSKQAAPQGAAAHK